MEEQSVAFTSHMATVFVEHEKLAGKVFKREQGLTTTEFCILRALYLAGGEVSGLDFVDYLMLKRNSISIAMSSLDKKGLVKKQVSSGDRRMLHIKETKEGRKVAHEAAEVLYQAQKNTFWNELSITDERGGNVVASMVLAKLRGVDYSSTAPLTNSNTPISPEFILFCKVVPQRWNAAIKSETPGLSLSEYRVLRHLTECKEARAADISRSLFLERSVVSNCKNTLLGRNFIHEMADEADHRNYVLTPSDEGILAEEHLRECLQRETSFMYEPCEKAGLAASINAWHQQMYESIRMRGGLLL